MTKLKKNLSRQHRNAVKHRTFSFGSTAVTAIIALAFGAFISAGFARPSITADTFRQLDLFGEIFEQVNENYVSTPDNVELIKGAVDGMMSTLDPHSSYMTAEDFQTMQEQTRGSFAGLGIEVTMDNEGPDKGYVKIVSPMDDTPAERAGLQSMDLIVEIDGAQVLGMSIDEAISNLKGERGTKVDISVLRNRDQDPFDVTLVRDIIKVQAVISRVEGDFGYVRIRTFSEQAADGLRKAIKSLAKEIPGGPKGYVLDLRSNPGGLLDQSVAVSDAFLDGGEIVSTRGRRPKDTLREMGTPGDMVNGRPIIVLINGGTASASEIVAGALQDRNRALLLGTKSFGKGSVQTVIPLENGLQGALRLTTARYYTPAGRSIQSLGIEPDILMPVLFPGQKEVVDRPSEKDLPGALAAEKAAEELPVEGAEAVTPEVEPVLCPEEEDCQLTRALELLADATAYRQALADAGASNN